MMIESVGNTPISRKQADALEADARRVAEKLGLSPDDVADTVRFPAAQDGSWTRGERFVWCWVVNHTARRLLEKSAPVEKSVTFDPSTWTGR
jgi:hypothetical protein